MSHVIWIKAKKMLINKCPGILYECSGTKMVRGKYNPIEKKLVKLMDNTLMYLFFK